MTRFKTRSIALIVVTLAHVLLLLWLLSLRPQVVRSLQRNALDVAAIFMVRLPPPPPPLEVAEEKPAAEARPAAKPAARKSDLETDAEKDAGPPKHGMGGGADFGNTISAPGAITLLPRRVPSDYADKVKARVVANLVRPEGAVFKPQAGDKADATYLQRQCTIPYEITVDREGKMVSYQIESCGDKLLDAAAEAALQKSGPFPPPPNAGAATYVIYGSANFRAK